MNRKELVQRWRNALGYGQREMFYYPVKNETKIETIEYFDIYFQTLKYYNYYDIINNYPQYAENIDKKYYYVSREAIAVFFNSDNTPLFKMNCYNGYRIKNIPFGFYRVKIIKSEGYILDEYIINVNQDLNKKTYYIELQQAYIKIETVAEFNNENETIIYEKNEYVQNTNVKKKGYSPWSLPHILSAQCSGRYCYKIFTYNDIYLGKIIPGNIVEAGGWGEYYNSQIGERTGEVAYVHVYYKFLPIIAKIEAIECGMQRTGDPTREFAILSGTAFHWNAHPYDYTTNFQSYVLKIGAESTIGAEDSINMPLLSFRDPAYNNLLGHRHITSTPNRDFLQAVDDLDREGETTSFFDGCNYNTLYDERKSIKELADSDELIKLNIRQEDWYNLYYEDGMTDLTHQNIVASQPITLRYIVIHDNGRMTIENSHICYEAQKDVADNTVCHFIAYPFYSEDYDLYNLLQYPTEYVPYVGYQYNFNEGR